eukprot:1462630-Prymnesium_polylepis.1
MHAERRPVRTARAPPQKHAREPLTFRKPGRERGTRGVTERRLEGSLDSGGLLQASEHQACEEDDSWRVRGRP